ncbi:signal recognition particle receptor subunit alpha homolog isoform X2 [Zophobas morio]|jgi:signal recognition particle receptor subunit alpha|uniref:signal recognition particle receptor subunit alpha homolog isoform X2 n=1 Tax=Zophobas morio TaxID=2755281 RepID=UPI0030839912
MLELFVIFSASGVILWTFNGQGYTEFKQNPASKCLNPFIKKILLEGRGGTQKVFEHDLYSLKWIPSKELQINFLAVVFTGLLSKAGYLDALLCQVRKSFFLFWTRITASLEKCTADDPLALWELHRHMSEDPSFSNEFVNIYESLEKSSREIKAKSTALHDFSLSALKSRGKHAEKPVHALMKERPSRILKEKKKKDRKWELSNRNTQHLDYSNELEGARNHGKIEELVKSVQGHSMRTNPPIASEEGTEDSTPLGSSVYSFFSGLVGSQTITKESLSSVVEQFKRHLVSKNVALRIAEDIGNALISDLTGTHKSSLKALRSVVRDSLVRTLQQLLSVKPIDILREIRAAVSDGTLPFVIIFCGVNGVGKSTNLAKVAYWLLQNDYKVLIAACDTFRSGAVEQLRIHQQALTKLNEIHKGKGFVKLLERGYNKDDAAIASEAIRFAKNERIEIVLIDTAGRMQDNEPLMRSLAKIVRVNKPSLVLFVGEALVGNEAVDQLTRFNQALARHSDTNRKTIIDGIILTKFDTVDDKVGAALSMVYTSGLPIVFVGSGQTYTDLHRFDVQRIVDSLLL